MAYTVDMSLRHLANLHTDRIASLPILILYLTDGCNSRCVTCDIWRNPRRNMPAPLAAALAAQVQPLGVRWVVLSGGEAMQHPDWPHIAGQMRAAGARVMLLTNGLLVRRQIDEVIATIDELIVSLDAGTAATYDAIRGVDAFDLVLDGIRAARAAGLPVTTRTTVQRANFRELPALIDAALSADVTTISFLTVDVSSGVAFGNRAFGDQARMGRSVGADIIPLLSVDQQTEGHTPPAESSALSRDEIAELSGIIDRIEREYAAAFAAGRMAESPAKLRRMLTYFNGLHGDGFDPPRCNAPHISAVVEVDGRVRPCYFLPVGGKVTPDHGLDRVLNDPDAVDLRRAVRLGQRGECDSCVCPLYKGHRALLTL